MQCYEYTVVRMRAMLLQMQRQQRYIDWGTNWYVSLGRKDCLLPL